MAIEVTQNKKISEGGKNGEKKVVGSEIRRTEAKRVGTYTLRNDIKERLLREK